MSKIMNSKIFGMLLLCLSCRQGSGEPHSTPEFCSGQRGQDIDELFHVTNGIIFPNSYNDAADSMTYVAEDDDIFIVSYPKAGTTWTQMIVTRILNGSGDMPDVFWTEGLDAVSPQLEKNGKLYVMGVQRPTAIKTHLPFNAIPWNKRAKYIVVLRNPKDVSVSYYFQLLATLPSLKGMDFHQFFCQYWISGQIPAGDYFDHVIGWWNHRNESNVLFIVYEDMKTDLPANIRKLASFLGPEYEKKIMTDDRHVLDKITRLSDFEPAKKELTETGHVLHNLRKGIIGDWQNYFSDNESQYVDRVMDQRFSGTGLENIWKGYGVYQSSRDHEPL